MAITQIMEKMFLFSFPPKNGLGLTDGKTAIPGRQ